MDKNKVCVSERLWALADQTKSWWRSRHWTVMVISAVVLVLLFGMFYVSVSGRFLPRCQETWSRSNNGRFDVAVGGSTVSSTTPRAAWSAGTTVRAASSQMNQFNQPAVVTLLVREGDDVQVDCVLPRGRHAVVSWYRGENVLLTVDRMRYVYDWRFSIYVDTESRSWALRIRRVTPEDADVYVCYLAVPAGDVTSTRLDVVPAGRELNPGGGYSWRKEVKRLYQPGFVNRSTNAVCPGQGADVEVCVFFMMSALDVHQRDRIRKSWGVEFRKLSPKVHLVFGVSKINESVSTSLNNESAQFGDIVEGKFAESSRDRYVNTFRMLNAFEFFTAYCQKASFLLLLQQQSNTTIVASAAQLLDLVAGLSAQTSVIYGRLSPSSPAVRDPSDQRYIQYSQHRSSSLPEYIRGPVVLYSRPSIDPLFQATLRRPELPFADVLINGVAAEEAMVARRDSPLLYTSDGDSAVSCAQRRRYAVFGSTNTTIMC